MHRPFVTDTAQLTQLFISEAWSADSFSVVRLSRRAQAGTWSYFSSHNFAPNRHNHLASMGSRAARSLLGPLVDGYRDLVGSKQAFDRPAVSPVISAACLSKPLHCAPVSTELFLCDTYVISLQHGVN